MSQIKPTEYEPYDGDYTDDDYTKLINDIQAEAGYSIGVYYEICVSLTSEAEIEILGDNEEGDEWEWREYYPIPSGWDIDKIKKMFAGYPVYMKYENR